MSVDSGESNNEVDASSQEAELRDADAPLVFQCAQCHTIIGDSSSWACANEILRTISLKYISKKVQVNKRLVTSSEGADLGSTYNTLKCEVCGEELGRLYKTTSREMDHMRGVFTLYVEKLSSYQIGSMEQCGKQSAGTDINDLITLGDHKAVFTELQKIQAVVVSLDLRVACLEKQSAEKIDVQNSKLCDQSPPNCSVRETNLNVGLSKESPTQERYNVVASRDLKKRHELLRDVQVPFNRHVQQMRRKISPDKRNPEGDAKRTRLV